MPGSYRGLRRRPKGVDVLPEAIRRARLEAGLTQAQVAEPELTRAAIHLIESGGVRPSMRTLRQIAERTGRPVSDFLPPSHVTPEERDVRDQLERLVATGDFSAAIACGEKLVERELPQEIEADVRFLLGRAYVRTMDGRSAYPHLLRARELYELTGDGLRIADALGQMACALYLDDDSRALAVACQAIDVCERLRPQQPELTVRTLMVLGMVYYRLQDWHRAMSAYSRALELASSQPTIRNAAVLHDHLSLTYQRLARFGDALEHARRASRLYQGSPDPTDVFRAEHNLGCILMRQGELTAARPHLKRALDLSNEPQLQRYFRSAALLGIGELNIADDHLEQAEALLDEALELVQAQRERSREAEAWRLLGRLHLRRRDYERAEGSYGRAAELFRSLDLRADLFDMQAEHADSLFEHGRDKDALRLYRQAIVNGRQAIQRVQSGGADVVAANWGS